MIAPDEFFDRNGDHSAVFSDREAHAEDQRAIAAEREELRVFLAEYEDWLDGRRDLPPDPLP